MYLLFGSIMKYTTNIIIIIIIRKHVIKYYRLILL